MQGVALERTEDVYERGDRGTNKNKKEKTVE
jgi:hypothetical protein